MKRVVQLGAGLVVVLVLVVGVIADSTRDEPQQEAVATPTVVTSTSTVPPTTSAPTSTTEAPTTTMPAADPGALGEAGAPVPRAVPHPEGPRFPTVVATSTKELIDVYTAPTGGSVKVQLRSPLPHSNVPVNFKVLGPAGNGMLYVALRTRPNGSTGYISTSDVTLTTHNWSIDIDVTAHYVTVYRGADVFLETYAVTGTRGTPTPLGDFFVTEGVREVNPSGPHGVFIYGLSAHSDVWYAFDGGDGQIGIHGTNQPQLMGTGSSNGCIRLTNDNISKLAAAMPLGTPVHIHR